MAAKWVKTPGDIKGKSIYEFKAGPDYTVFVYPVFEQHPPDAKGRTLGKFQGYRAQTLEGAGRGEYRVLLRIPSSLSEAKAVALDSIPYQYRIRHRIRLPYEIKRRRRM